MDVALGDITVSTPKLRPAGKETDPKNRLDFGAMKVEDNIRLAIETANLSAAELQYETLALSFALKMAGPQISASDSITTKGAAGIAPDLSGVTLGDLMPSLNPETVAALMADPATALATRQQTNNFADIKLNPNLSYGGSRESSYKETLTSPGYVTPPAPPQLAKTFSDVLPNIYSLAKATNRLDPRQEASLVAAYKTYMVALEEFYNADELYAAQLKDADGSGWLPYRVYFTVNVEPGWYSYLQKFDGVAELEFSVGSPTAVETKILSIAPAETAQTVDELTAGFQQLSLATKFDAAEKLFGISSSLDKVLAQAERLQGFRRNTTAVVSYPRDGAVRIRIRPSVIPTAQGAELQPTSILFSGTVLIKKLPGETTSLEASADGSKPSVGTMNVSYTPYFEPAAALRSRTRPLFLSAIGIKPVKRKFFAPNSSDRWNRYYVEESSDGKRALAAVIPTFPSPKKEFGFAKNVTGFYDPDATTATANIQYVVSNPSYKNGNTKVSPVCSLTIDGKPLEINGVTTPTIGSGEGLTGTARLSGLPKPANGAPMRVLVHVSRTGEHGEEAEVQEVTLATRAVPSPPPPASTITIDTTGVKVSPTDPKTLSPEFLKAILGDRIFINQPKP